MVLLPPTPALLQAMMTTIATMTTMSKACMHLQGIPSSEILYHAVWQRD